MAAYRRVHDSHHLQAKNRDQLRNPTLGNRVWAIPLPFTFTYQRWLRVRMNRKSVAPLRHDTERSANRRAGV